MRRFILVLAFVSLSLWLAGQSINSVTLVPSKNTYSVGEKLKIKWSYSGISSNANVKITLWKSNGTKSFCLIADNVQISRGSSGYSWTIPSKCKNPHDNKTYALAGSYKVKIRWKKHPAGKFSNNFNIGIVLFKNWKKVIDPSLSRRKNLSLPLTVITPNSSSRWVKENTYEIKWRLPMKTLITTYRIELYRKNTLVEKVCDKITLARPSKEYSYKWKIPRKIMSGYYKVKISCGDREHPQLYVGYSNTFGILSRIISRDIPAQFFTSYRTKSEKKQILPNTDQTLYGIDLPKNGIKVGFENHYKESGIFGVNHQYYGIAYRGIMTFDLSEFKKKRGLLLKAVLHMSLGNSRKSYRPCTVNVDPCPPPLQGEYTATNLAYCAKSIYYLKAPWSDFNTPAVYLRDIPRKHEIEINVIGTVREWLIGRKPNYGFEVVGVNESFSKNNDVCTSVYENIYLHVEFLDVSTE